MRKMISVALIFLTMLFCLICKISLAIPIGEDTSQDLSLDYQTEEDYIVGPILELKNEDVVSITLGKRFGEKPRISSLLAKVKIVTNARPDGGLDITVDNMPVDKAKIGIIVYNVSDVSKIHVSIIGVLQNKVDTVIYAMPKHGVAGIIIYNKTITQKNN